MTDVHPEPHLIQIAFRLKFGRFTDDERQAIVDTFRESDLGQVRIDEVIASNLGIGGPGGLPIEFDVWLNIGQQAAGALLALAIAKGIAPALKIVGKRIVRLVAVVRKGEAEPVTYIADPGDVQEALDAMPADYEETIQTESRLRVWRNGRWEHNETTTRNIQGRG